MKLFMSLLTLILISGCNPELQTVGASKNDLVKYFKITRTGSPDDLGEGYLIIAHAGDKRLLTYYLKTPRGFSHTDISLTPGEGKFVLDSVHSQTTNCKLSPDFNQPDFYNFLNIEGVKKIYKLESTTREEAMAEKLSLSC